MTQNKPAIDYFNDRADTLAAQYNALDRQKVHADLLAQLPAEGALSVLDIGAGSGADAAMFADKGHKVVAAEPAQKLRVLAQKAFGNKNIEWNDDVLPELRASSAGGRVYDVVTATGVLQYLDEKSRVNALNKMFSMVAPGGFLEIQYPTPASREHQYSVADIEVDHFTKTFNATSAQAFEIVVDKSIPDHTGRKALDGSDLFFKTLVLRRIR